MMLALPRSFKWGIPLYTFLASAFGCMLLLDKKDVCTYLPLKKLKLKEIGNKFSELLSKDYVSSLDHGLKLDSKPKHSL